MLDFARVYSFLGSIFDPDTSEHLQRLKVMDPIDVETVLLLMRNLSINLTSPDFEEHHERSSSVGHLCKQCGFIQFVNRADAEEALQGPNGVTIGKQAVRLSRGRSLASKQGADRLDVLNRVISHSIMANNSGRMLHLFPSW
ncbi:unnamed protein product [Urochloa humidicola]